MFIFAVTICVDGENFPAILYSQRILVYETPQVPWLRSFIRSIQTTNSLSTDLGYESGFPFEAFPISNCPIFVFSRRWFLTVTHCGIIQFKRSTRFTIRTTFPVVLTNLELFSGVATFRVTVGRGTFYLRQAFS